MSDLEKALARFTMFQHGLATRRQMRGAGWSISQIDRQVSKGRLIVVYSGVYRVAGFPVTSHQRILAASLSTKSTASHRAAASVWGADLGPTPPLEVMVRGDRHP